MDRMIELVNERTRIEKWAADYLEENSELMDDVSNKHPVYKEYLQKMEQYQKICDQIRVLTYERSK